MNLTRHCLTLLLLLAVLPSAYADSWRCGQRLVKTGDSPAAVRTRCGEPEFRDRVRISIREQGKRQTVSAQRWFYRQGRRRYGKHLIFYAGELRRIERVEP